MSAEFLLEIGTEEIPSGYLENGLKELKQRAESCLEEKRIPLSGGLFTYGTPRRLVLIGREMADRQEDMVQEVTGPPKRAAYDQDGTPTKAATGFAKKYGLSVDDLECVETSKGEYLHIRRTIPGRPVVEVLAEILPKLITDIPWPKSMVWGDVGVPFVRPVHWVVALFGNELIPFDVAGVKSGSTTRGHRFMAPGPMEVSGVEDYLMRMEEGSVMIDPEERRRKIEKEVLQEAEEVSGIPMKDPELLATVANLVEYPSAVCGTFDSEFLDLPEPVLITAMRKHQKYFAIKDGEGRLMPNFVAVNNTMARDEAFVLKGHERVLRARLSDADFFFREDRKRPLEDRLDDLKEVIYQAELGTSYAKVERFTELAEYLAEQVAPEKKGYVRLAARLCKCDLVTEMIMEFPTLQGVMGKEYARLDGHPEEVCLAIHDHYLPARAWDELPTSIPGSIVGLADRMDSIAGSFVIGQEPTGAADPFALRRHALAIIRILEETGWEISLNRFISKALDVLGEEIEFDREQFLENLLSFFRERYRNKMSSAGFESDLIEAVVSVEFDQISQLRFRIDQLKRFMIESSEFESLAQTVKRVSNILKKQKESLTVDEGLFKEPCESGLWKAYQGLKDNIHGLMEKGDYLEALNLMATLRRPVDDFFDGVEVMTKDSPELRENRVGILQHLARLFMSLADFSRFSI